MAKSFQQYALMRKPRNWKALADFAKFSMNTCDEVIVHNVETARDFLKVAEDPSFVGSKKFDALLIEFATASEALVGNHKYYMEAKAVYLGAKSAHMDKRMADFHTDSKILANVIKAYWAGLLIHVFSRTATSLVSADFDRKFDLGDHSGAVESEAIRTMDTLIPGIMQAINESSFPYVPRSSTIAAIVREENGILPVDFEQRVNNKMKLMYS